MSQKSHIEQMLERDGVIVYKTRGVSMRPMLKQNRDLVTVRKFEGRLKKYDVPLYRRKTGGYVLHRIIGLKDDCYIIRGDNTFKKEYVPDSEVLGVLTEFKRKGRNHSVDSAGYKLYARFWNLIYPLRWVMSKSKVLGSKVKRFIFRRK